MEKKQLWVIISGLILVNCLTVAFFLTKQGIGLGSNEVVATVGNEEITRADWLSEIEKRFGKDVLEDLINQKVIYAMAEKYSIKVPETAIERELHLVKTMYGTADDQTSNEEEWKKQIEYSLMLEEIMTKDVVISDEELERYYEQNRSLFSIPTSYHISHIVVKTKDDAEQTFKELKSGSSFSTLAMERSIDEFSAAQGGDLGYIREGDSFIPSNYFQVIQKIKQGEWSKPFQTGEGFVIVLLHEKIKGKDYSFKEVKGDIRRQMALEQMEGTTAAEVFWNEINVKWYYGEE